MGRGNNKPPLELSVQEFKPIQGREHAFECTEEVYEGVCNICSYSTGIKDIWGKSGSSHSAALSEISSHLLNKHSSIQKVTIKRRVTVTETDTTSIGSHIPEDFS